MLGLNRATALRRAGRGVAGNALRGVEMRRSAMNVMPLISQHQQLQIASLSSTSSAGNSKKERISGNTIAALLATGSLLAFGSQMKTTNLESAQTPEATPAAAPAAAPTADAASTPSAPGAQTVTTTKWTFYSGKHVAPEKRENFLLIGGNGNPLLAQEVSKYLGVGLASSEIAKFSDGEISVKIMENVRGKDCYVIQPTCPPVNDNLMELLLITSCLRRSSARRITLVMPYYGYARADRRLASRSPISARDVATMLETVGADRIMVVDMHSGQAQGFFSHQANSDNIPANKVGALFFSEMKDLQGPVVVVTTRSAGVARAKEFRDILASQAKKVNNPAIADPLFAMVLRPLKSKLQAQKSLETQGSAKVIIESASQQASALRPDAEETGAGEDEEEEPADGTSGAGKSASSKTAEKKVPNLELVGIGNSVEGCDCIIVTDIVDTARGLSEAAIFLKAKGARRVYAYASHGIFSEGALERIRDAGIDRVVVSNTVPATAKELADFPMITRLSIAPIIAESIRRVHEKENLSDLLE